jgi:hypothetical protein
MVSSTEWRQSYREVFRRDVFELLHAGFEGAKSLLSSDDEETVISSRLVDAIEDYLQTAPERFDRYHAQAEHLVRSDSRLGRWRRRIDIYIAGGLDKRASFSFEAKRLKLPGHPVGAYVGPDGLELFVEEEYAAEESEAGLIGYIQSDSAEVWFERVATALQADKSGRLRVIEGLAEFPVDPRLSPIGRSKHLRPSRGALLLYHVFLRCM